MIPSKSGALLDFKECPNSASVKSSSAETVWETVGGSILRG